MFKKTILLFTIALLLVSNAYALTVSNPVASSKDLPDADFDNDNRVDFDDFFLLTEAFGTDNYLFDLNGDDIVDDKDLTLFQEHFGEIYGCTDSTATNYNSEANTDNGSCKYPAPKPTPILGCTDSTALNYNPDATQNDGSCQYQQPPAPQPITPKDADFDNDGDVDFDDFFLFSDNFGTNVAKYDLNKDGKVDFDDFFIFADNFGQKVLPTSADFDNNGVVNMTDFELFVQKFGTNIAEYDLNKDGKVDFDDFFIFADNFGQTVVLPEIQVLLSNPSPADNAEGVNSASRTFSFYSLVTPGGRVTYELYLSNAGTWPGNSMSIKNLENLNGKTPFGSITSSESRPNILVKNLNEYTVYYWRIKAIDSSGKVYLSPVWKFFTHNAGSSPENEFVALSENKLPTAQIQKPEEGYRNGKESYIKFSGIGNDADGVIISYEWLIDSIMHYKGQDKSNVVAYFYQSGDYLVNFRVQDDKGAWSKWTTLDIKIDENYVPNIPSNPSPRNGSKITSSYFTFSWDGGDKDNEDVTYNLIISKNPEFTWIQKTTKFTFPVRATVRPNIGVSDLDSNRDYWWKVIATDSNGYTTESPVWVFGPTAWKYTTQGEPPVGPTVVYGCTDPAALNYNPAATQNDGSCTYASLTPVLGCTDPAATNYNPAATQNDGSCTYASLTPVLGCTDPAATNYNPAATQNDGSCTYASLTPVLGCTDPAATNYNPAATQNDGSCIYVVPNQAPVLASIGNKNVNEGALLSFSISATDVDGDALTYSVSGLPSGASFIGQTFTWTPTFSQSGVYTVTFTVNDGKGGIDSKTITITVVNVNQGPVLTISDITVAEGEKAVIAPVATDFDNDPITYTVSDSRFKQTASNRFEWATWYYDAGSYLVTVRASTPDGLFDSKQITVRVKDNKIEHPNVEVKNAVVMNLGGVVRYGQPLELYVNIANTGNTDDEDTRVTVIIPELNIYEELGIFSLDRGNKYLDIVDIDLGNNVEPGKEYYFIVRAQSDEATALKYGSFLVA